MCAHNGLRFSKPAVEVRPAHNDRRRCDIMSVVSSGARLLNERLYTYPEIDHILGLTAGTSRRWINGYFAQGERYSPVVRRRSLRTERATWGEFIEVYYLSRFRRSGIPLQKLRRTLMSVRERMGTHYLFSHESILYADRETLEVIGHIQAEEGVPFLVTTRTGQLHFEIDPHARARLERITYEGGIARSVKPRLDLDNVVVSAERFFGKPKIVGTGISPGAVARLVWNGTPTETVAELYHLSPGLIDEAGRFSYGTQWQPAA